MADFPIRSRSKKELALCYFPDSENPHSAVNHLMSWIKRCHGLLPALEAQGYQKSSKWFTPRQVKLIVEYLGDP